MRGMSTSMPDLSALPKHATNYLALTYTLVSLQFIILKYMRKTVHFEAGHLKERAQLPPVSHLEAWLKLNSSSVGELPNSHLYKYHEIPEHYSWNAQEHEWVPRSRHQKEPTLGRMYYVHPGCEDKERFFLRLLLTHRPGMQNYQDCRMVTVDGHTTVFTTFEEACDALGLLDDDADIRATLDEAITFQLWPQLLAVFASMTCSCSWARLLLFGMITRNILWMVPCQSSG
mmetsp:Transcript_29159/g.86294  ORF Transcript_29159/g.86294 Transcript_29159/m.86294 type:complete len:230 (+) Transcript_29159:1139-1828(+)